MLYANEYSSDDGRAQAPPPAAGELHLDEPVRQGRQLAPTEQQQPRRRKERTPSSDMDNVCSFVQKLYNLVDNPEHERFVQWNEMGDVFIVFHCEEFAQTVLPRYFKHSKFPSFVRQLNIYGFYRVSDARKTPLVRSKEACVFSHKYFKKSRKELLPLIRRKVGPKKDHRVAATGSASGSGSRRSAAEVAASRKQIGTNHKQPIRAKSTNRDTSHPPEAFSGEGSSDETDMAAVRYGHHHLLLRDPPPPPEILLHPHHHHSQAPPPRYLQYASAHHDLHLMDSYVENGAWETLHRPAGLDDYNSLYYEAAGDVERLAAQQSGTTVSSGSNHHRDAVLSRRGSDTLTHASATPTSSASAASTPGSGTEAGSSTISNRNNKNTTTTQHPRRPPPILTSFDPPKLTHLSLPPLSKSDYPHLSARTHQGFLFETPTAVDHINSATGPGSSLPTPVSACPASAAAPRLTHAARGLTTSTTSTESGNSTSCSSIRHHPYAAAAAAGYTPYTPAAVSAAAAAAAAAAVTACRAPSTARGARLGPGPMSAPVSGPRSAASLSGSGCCHCDGHHSHHHHHHPSAAVSAFPRWRDDAGLLGQPLLMAAHHAHLLHHPHHSPVLSPWHAEDEY
ncbi:kinase-regulated stress-responsive transcription factor skn7 [Geranomyces variabilis]|nr:kinase-regulated stress-responsive transcription factor skn7 [Geranomyces variabilis]